MLKDQYENNPLFSYLDQFQQLSIELRTLPENVRQKIEPKVIHIPTIPDNEQIRDYKKKLKSVGEKLPKLREDIELLEAKEVY